MVVVEVAEAFMASATYERQAGRNIMGVSTAVDRWRLFKKIDIPSHRHFLCYHTRIAARARVSQRCHYFYELLLWTLENSPL
jgi:hypothetical protein